MNVALVTKYVQDQRIFVGRSINIFLGFGGRSRVDTREKETQRRGQFLVQREADGGTCHPSQQRLRYGEMTGNKLVLCHAFDSICFQGVWTTAQN